MVFSNEEHPFSIEIELHPDNSIGNCKYLDDAECYGGVSINIEDTNIKGIINDIKDNGTYFEFTILWLFYDDVEITDYSEETIKATIIDGKMQIISAEESKNLNGLVLEQTDGFSNSITWEEVLNFLLGILIMGIFLWVMGHMIWTLTRPKRFPVVYTVDMVKDMRKNAGLSEDSSDDENQNVIDQLEHAFDTWAPFVNEDGEDDKAPTKKSMMMDAEERLNAAIAIMPTDPDVIEAINATSDCINENWKRSFSGNKFLIGIGVVLLILMGYTAGWSAAVFFIFNIAIYVLSCYKPTFMHNKDILRNSKSFSSGCLAAIFGFIASAQTIRTITTYSNGTKTVDDDHSQHWIHLIIGIIVLLFIGIFLFVWALINYLRNYVFYW